MKFILCAGQATRWIYHTPKQLIEVDGESLLYRTERLIGNTGIVVSSNKGILKHAQAYEFRTHIPVWQETIVHSIVSTANLWEDVNTFYLGDVYFTDECMKTIETSVVYDIHFIGSKREIFAVKIRNTDMSKGMLTACTRIEDCKLWNLYYYIALGNAKPGNHTEPLSDSLFTVIDDKTRDFDQYSDYINFRRNR